MSTAGEISGGGARYYAEPRTHKRHDMDWYIEPAWTVDLLLDAEPFDAPMWDPACGCGTIPKAIAARDRLCFASDAADRGYGQVHDFLGMEPAPFRAASIITNPPYGLAEDFVRQALCLTTGKVAALVQAKFLYSQRRHALFNAHPPLRVYHLSSRPSMPPGEKLLAGTVEPKGGKMDYCWVVWDFMHDGPTETRWLRRPR